MQALDPYTWVISCNERVMGSERISLILQNPLFINRIRELLVNIYEGYADFSILIRHITYLMHSDNEFRSTVQNETSTAFVNGYQYPWFCFWCSIIIYRSIESQLEGDVNE